MKRIKTYSSYLALFWVCFLSPSLNANPEGGAVVNGNATFDQQGSTLTVTNTPGTIINWQDFSIQKEETTRFVQQSSDSAVLNRVVGQDPSQILGNLESNGRVFIINPNGIVFGADSVIDVSGLAASTLNLSNEDFLSQNLNFTGDGTNGNISNEGAITTSEGGFVYLIASNVENHGVIRSPKGEVILAAGHSVQLVSSDDPDIRVTLTAPEGEALNVGEIITRGGKTSIYAGIINQQGKVSADSAVVGENGKIFFKATQRTTLTSTSITTANGNQGGNITIKTTQGLTEVSGVVTATGDSEQGGEILILGEHVGILDEANIDTSGQTGGGTILIGGDNKGNNPDIKNAKATYVGVNTQIHADAVEEGDGGKVIVWSDDATRAYGTITAKGGSVLGNGGFVETSGGYLDVAGLNLDLTSTNGSGGTWLLDPYDIIVSGTTTVNSTSGPVYTPTATASNIFAGDIETQLNSGTSVTVDTTGAGAELGNITVNAGIAKTAGTATTLTLKAHNDITINQSISASSGTLNVSLIADQDSNNAGSINVNAGISTLGSTITMTSYGDITLNSGVNTIQSIGAASNISLTSTNGSIVGDPAGGPTDVTADIVTLNAATGISANGGSAQFTTKTNVLSFNNSGTGLVRIHNSVVGAASVTGTNNSGDIIIQNTDNANALTVGNITASNGFISLNSDIIDITGTVNAGANVVYLKNFVNNAAISVEGGALFDISSAELANITAGNIQIGKDTFGNYAGAATIASSANVDVGGKNLWVTAKNGVTVSAFNVNNTGGELYIDNITSGNIQTGGGVITADKVQFRSIGNVNISTGGINSTATGNVYLLGADVNIAGPVNAGANSVYLSPYLSNTAISIGGSQIFDITQTDINNITTSTLYIGTPDGSTAYASTVDVASVTAIDAGARILNIHSTGNTSVGANILSATGGYLQFYNAGGGTFTSGAGQISGTTFYTSNYNDITIGAGGISTVDAITLNGTNGINQNGNITSSAGTITASATNGFITMGSGAVSSTNGANITYSANGNITLGRLYTGVSAGNVSVTSSAGSITDAGAANENIYASTATLNAATGIGNAGFDVFFNNLGTTNLTANTTSGGVNINSNSAMNLGNIYGGTGSVNLTTTGGASYMSSGASIVSGTGVFMNSSQNMSIGVGGVNSNGALSLTAAGTLSQSGNLSTTAAGNITLIANSANLNAISTSAGTIGIEADQVTLAGFVNANSGTGTIYIMPRNLNAISIDGSDVFDLTQGELTNLSFGTLFIGSDGTTTRATTASISTIASTTVGGGSATATIQALNDITFGANNFSAVGANIIVVSDGGNIITGAGNITAGTVTLNAANNILDGNGNGVVDIIANNLTVSSGGNSSLDYQITGTLNSTGVVGTADLRAFTAGTTTTTTSSTNEPLTTTIATIANTTNTLSTGTTSTSTTLSEPTATDTSTDTTTGDSTTESSTTTADGTTSETTASNSEDETNKDSESTTTSSDEKQPQSLAKKLPICK